MTRPDRAFASTSGFDRRVSEALRDAGRYLPPLAEPGPGDEDAAIAVLESSAVIKWFDRAITRASAARETSLAVGVVRRLRSAVAPRDQRLLVGIVLLVAPFVHLGLVMWHERPAGWQWLILPALSFSIGIMFAMFGAAERRETG